MKDFLNKMSEKASDMKDAVSENFSMEKLSEKIASVSDGAKDKITKTTNDLISLSPIIEEMGYKTTSISVTVGLPPDVTFHFQKTADVSAERRAEIMAQHKDKALLGTVVKMLVATDEHRDKLKLGAFKFNNIDVCIGLTPGMTIQLVPEEN
ncbi:MAG: hypothetical protein ACTHKV_11075 [Flavipsychrobacter sp.]